MPAHIAPLIAGWQQRLGALAGPLGAVSAGSGESPSGAALQVELLLNGIWTDVSSRVMTRDGGSNIAITRGQAAEGSSTGPSTCTFHLNNRDGLFSPRNPTSPIYGQIGRNTQLRVSVQSGNDKNYRFWGEVSDWPQQWDQSGTDVWVEVSAAGILRRLSQGSPQIGSSLRTALSTGSTDTATVVAYWPCEDSVGSTSIASGLSRFPPMSIAGNPTLANFTGFIGSAPLPTFTATTRFTGAVPTYAPNAATAVIFLVVIPVGGLTDGQVLCSIYMSGTVARWDVFYAAAGAGALGMIGFNSAGGTVTTIAAVGSQFNGASIEFSVQFMQSGADLSVAFTAEVVSLVPEVGYIGSGTATGQTGGLVTSLVMAPNLGLANTVFGQIVVETSASQFPDNPLDLDLFARTGEVADDRIFRLCGIAGIAFEQIGATFDFVQFVRLAVAMGPQPIGRFLDLIDQCVVADGGILYEIMTGIGIGYRTRVSLENQAPALTLSYSSANLSAALKPVDDDRFTRNDITVSRTGGSSSRATQTTGRLSIQQPPAGVGPYTDAVSVNVHQDSDLADQAGWRLHLGTVDEARYPQISVNLAHQSFAANPTLRQQVLAVRPGDRLVVTNPPAWMPPDQISQLVIGFSEQIDQFQHRITFNCVPESPYRTAVLEDAVLGRLDTGGSQLAADALPTDTTLSVATTVGPLWTTTDTPFDVRISGEQITVTGVTGAVSPQTFTCTRSVNGVVKPLAVNADVRLNQPMILAL